MVQIEGAMRQGIDLDLHGAVAFGVTIGDLLQHLVAERNGDKLVDSTVTIGEPSKPRMFLEDEIVLWIAVQSGRPGPS